jgi:hypothetical protein
VFAENLDAEKNEHGTTERLDREPQFIPDKTTDEATAQSHDKRDNSDG